MLFFAYYNAFAMKQLVFDETLQKPTDSGFKATISGPESNNYTAVVFSNEEDQIAAQALPRMPLVNGDLIYYFPLPNTRLSGVVMDGAVFDVKFKLSRGKVRMWLEDKYGSRYDFPVASVPNVLLIKQCLRKFVDRQGVVVWCQQ